MSAATVITDGYGTFSNVNFVIPDGYGDYAVDEETAAATPQHAGSRSKRRRQYRHLVVRINGEFIEVESVEKLMELLREAKKEVATVAQAKVADLVREGKRVGAARIEEAKSIELVQAPEFAKHMIETRIREMEVMYWEAVEKAMRRVIEIEDEEMLLNG